MSAVAHEETEAALVTSTVGVALMAWLGHLSCSRCPASLHASANCCEMGSGLLTVCVCVWGGPPGFQQCKMQWPHHFECPDPGIQDFRPEQTPVEGSLPQISH